MVYVFSPGYLKYVVFFFSKRSLVKCEVTFVSEVLKIHGVIVPAFVILK